MTRDPDTGLWLLPTGDGPWSRSLPSWPPFTTALRRLVLPLVDLLPRPGPKRGSKDQTWGLPETVLVPCVLGLVPCLDNDYNPQAVAVVNPGVDGAALDLAAQVAWIRDEQVWALQPSIVALAVATDGEVGCHGYVEFDRMLSAVDFDDTDLLDYDDWGPDAYADALTPVEVGRDCYRLSGLRGRITGGREVEAAVRAHTLR